MPNPTWKVAALVLVTLASVSIEIRAELPIVESVERQPLAAQVKRVREALDHLGVPLRDADQKAFESALAASDDGQAVSGIQRALDSYCLLGVAVNSETEMKVTAGPAKRQLVEQGWTQFLVKVHNPKGLRGELSVASPEGQRLAGSPADDVPNRWLDLQMFNQQPLLPQLSGLTLEYRIVQLYSRDAGHKEASLFCLRGAPKALGRPRSDVAPRNNSPAAKSDSIKVAFDCAASREVTFRVSDEQGKPTTAAFVIRDPQGRVYPSQAKRLAPDFAFHPQIYRGDGETLKLPAGNYRVECSRGPESISRRNP